MVTSSYTTGLFLITVLGWSSWAVVITKLSPFTSTTLALLLFYASLCLALTGTFTLLNYYLRLMMNKRQIYNAQFNTALRQGLLLSLMVCIALIFQRLKVLTWWDSLLLLGIVLLIEFYFMAKNN